MNKSVRIVLYILSALTLAGVIAAIILLGGNAAEETTAETVKQQQAMVTEIQENETETTLEEAIAEEVTTEETTETVIQDSKTTILFTGDVLFANAFKAGYDQSGIRGVVSEDVLALLQEADILMVNNEFPYSERGAQMIDKQFTFRCEPSYVKALNEMGVDVVSLANNHTLDYGKEALSDTFTTLDNAGILYGGAGETVERAEEVQIIEVNGKKFGFLAVSRVIPVTDWKVENSTPGIFSCYDDTRLLELIRQAKESCDFLAVYPHWGVEYDAYPDGNQTKIAKNCIEAGADIVVGSHTHCLQGAEFLDGKPVFYSLGNFIFGRDIDRSAVLEVTVEQTGEVSYRLLPVYAAGGVTQFPDAAGAEDICAYLDKISTGAHIADDGIVTE